MCFDFISMQATNDTRVGKLPDIPNETRPAVYAEIMFIGIKGNLFSSRCDVSHNTGIVFGMEYKE